MFRFGNGSWTNLEFVHPRLIGVSVTALGITTIDFGVINGLRTHAEQQEMLRIGASQTLNSKHLKQRDGFAHAVDVMAYLNGAGRWEEALYYPIAEAFRAACRQHRVGVRWGGCWGSLLDIDRPLQEAVAFYVKQRQAEGRKPFVDLGHFELMEE